MELHHKIIGILKQEFPELKLPEIQEGFPVAISVTIDYPGRNAGDQLKSEQFDYLSSSGRFTYMPVTPCMAIGIAGTSIEAFQETLRGAKANGQHAVKVSVTYLCNAITV